MNSASEVGWAEGTASRSQKKGHQLQETFPRHFQDPARTLMICLLLVLQLDSTLELQEVFGKTLIPGFHLQPLWFNSSRVCLDWEYLSFPNDSDVLSSLGAVVYTTYAAAGRNALGAVLWKEGQEQRKNINWMSFIWNVLYWVMYMRFHLTLKAILWDGHYLFHLFNKPLVFTIFQTLF